MICNTAAFNPVHTHTCSFLSTFRRYFNALLETNHETPYGLPAHMAARLYL